MIINLRLSALPPIFAAYPLLPDIVVPEPLLLRYFASYVSNLPADQQPAAQRRFDVALNIYFTAMIVGTIDMDHYWTDRSVLLPDETLQFLCDSALKPAFKVRWTDGAESDNFTIREVVDLATALQYANLRQRYMRLDRRDKEATFVAYPSESGGYAVAAADSLTKAENLAYPSLVTVGHLVGCGAGQFRGTTVALHPALPPSRD